MILRKHYLDRIMPFAGTDVIKVVTGLRRSGKSVLLQQIREEIEKCQPEAEIFYLDLEERGNAAYLKKDRLYDELSSLLEKRHGKPVAILLDEIQEVEEWEKQINSLRKRRNADIYITGSNSRLFSGELATYLTGRYVEFKLDTFSFQEFKEASREQFGTLSKEELLYKYLEFGGLPFLPQIGYDQMASRTYLDDLYWAIVSKDVVRRLKIRDVDLLDRILRYVLGEIGHSFSAANIVRFLKSERRSVSPETILNYLRACEEAFLLKRLSRQDIKGRKVLSVDEKFYAGDLGLRQAAIGGKSGGDIDQKLENVVETELARRGFEIFVGRLGEKEIDFVCQKGEEKLYVQVCYAMGEEATREREFSALQAISDNYPKLVLSLDHLDFSRNGIKHVYLPDFLLGND